jgi:hypothetical protein
VNAGAAAKETTDRSVIVGSGARSGQLKSDSVRLRHTLRVARMPQRHALAYSILKCGQFLLRAGESSTGHRRQSVSSAFESGATSATVSAGGIKLANVWLSKACAAEATARIAKPRATMLTERSAVCSKHCLDNYCSPSTLAAPTPVAAE